MIPALGWHMLAERTRWTASGYDLTAAMKKVHIDFWQDSLFAASVSTDRVDTTQNVVEVADLSSSCSTHTLQDFFSGVACVNIVTFGQYLLLITPLCYLIAT